MFRKCPKFDDIFIFNTAKNVVLEIFTYSEVVTAWTYMFETYSLGCTVGVEYKESSFLSKVINKPKMGSQYICDTNLIPT